jgi:hypothetical protein
MLYKQNNFQNIFPCYSNSFSMNNVGLKDAYEKSVVFKYHQYFLIECLIEHKIFPMIR